MRKPKSESDLKPRGFKRVPLTSRALVTIGPDHGFWQHDDPLAANAYYDTVHMGGEDPERCGGVIVRVRPPPHAKEAWVQRLVGELKTNGAAGVKVEWPSRPATIPPQKFASAIGPGDGIRAVVMRLVEQANTRDRGALKQAAEAALAAAGL